MCSLSEEYMKSRLAAADYPAAYPQIHTHTQKKTPTKKNLPCKYLRFAANECYFSRNEEAL